MRQYVIVKFRETDTRGYTYHNDGPAVAPGEAVKIPDRHGDGWTRRKVHAVTYEKPEGKFETREILGLAPAEPATELDLGPKCNCPALGDPIPTTPQPVCPVHQI